jgi:hypothetical protein
MTQHTTRAHAKRSPSSAYRWMNCPGSIRMSEGIAEGKASIFADEGTAAHMLAERCLRHSADTDHFIGTVIDIHGTEYFNQFLTKGAPLTDGRFEVDEEMAEGVQLFLDTVREIANRPGCELHVERRVNFSGDEFGTADAIVVERLGARTVLHVFDLKYGSGVLVEVKDAEGNPNKQLVCYGEGSVREIDGETPSLLTITIVQPRMPHPDGRVRSVDIGPLELLDWSIEIDLAVAATREATAPLIPGDWCGWCPAAGVCPTYAAKALTVAQADFDDLDAVQLPEPERLSPQQIGRIIPGLDMLEDWAKAVRKAGYAMAENGTKIPGQKLVDKIGRRAWIETKDAATLILHTSGLAPTDIYTEPKLKSPAQIEKLVGKKDFAARYAGLAPSRSSGTVLVPNNDRRPEVVPAIEQFDVLDDEPV